MKPVQVGLSYEGQVMPQPSDLASAVGNVGVHVVSSPATICYLEMASLHAIRDLLESGEGTVGVDFQLRHVGASRSMLRRS